MLSGLPGIIQVSFGLNDFGCTFMLNPAKAGLAGFGPAYLTNQKIMY